MTAHRARHGVSYTHDWVSSTYRGAAGPRLQRSRQPPPALAPPTCLLQSPVLLFPDLSFPDPGMVEGEGFEPSKAEPADLQSAPFDRSGTPPSKRAILAVLPSCGQTPKRRIRRGRCEAKLPVLSASCIAELGRRDQSAPADFRSRGICA